MYGDQAPGTWLSFENAIYLYLRFEGDLFGSSLPAGSWWDVHAARGREAPMPEQLAAMRRFIEVDYGGHCGLRGPSKPLCPAGRESTPETAPPQTPPPVGAARAVFDALPARLQRPLRSARAKLRSIAGGGS